MKFQYHGMPTPKDTPKFVGCKCISIDTEKRHQHFRCWFAMVSGVSLDVGERWKKRKWRGSSSQLPPMFWNGRVVKSGNGGYFGCYFATPNLLQLNLLHFVLWWLRCSVRVSFHFACTGFAYGFTYTVGSIFWGCVSPCRIRRIMAGCECRVSAKATVWLIA